MKKKKWVIRINAEDGTHTEIYSSIHEALNYMNSQTGWVISLEEVQSTIKKVGYFTITDIWGRVIELLEQNIGTCRVCKSKDTPLYTLLINPTWHKVPNEYPIDVCPSCADDFECGGWTVEYKSGRHRVKKLEY